MSDRMKTLSFDELLGRIRGEYETSSSIFGIPQNRFFKKQTDRVVSLFDQTCTMPIGPAAGPHTQLAQNIVTAFLTGGRFIELKTVQKMDKLEIPKPCIDAELEGYNTEWSTELTVEQAQDEYIKAWILIHFLQRALFPRETQPGVIFNMSVGYDLEGIKTSKIDSFIEGLKDASTLPSFKAHVECIQSGTKQCKFDGMFQHSGESKGIIESPEAFPSSICRSVALSTMHGCPPAEIESICRYLLSEKKLDTYVKLNPTLLGYEIVSKTLTDLGYGHIHLREHSFTHDLQYGDAAAMLRRLHEFAAAQGRKFGVKLSNTLAVVNEKQLLPGDEMYMSGRALYPLTIMLSAKLAAEFDGRIHISYSGGADFSNIRDIFGCGIQPITMATDILKPGGYLRMAQLADYLETMPDSNGWKSVTIDVPRLETLAKQAVQPVKAGNRKSAKAGMKFLSPLPLFDCAMAPCVANCPIRQDIPEYIHQLSQGCFMDALELILSRNPLPNITGTICDHQCMAACTRNDYDEAVLIRGLKLVAAERGRDGRENTEMPLRRKSTRVAVVGAGPSGLAAACFLARGGLDVTVLDRAEEAGGTVRYVIPRFRITPETIQKDIDSIKSLGVSFQTDKSENLTIRKMKSRGFQFVYLAIGAGKSNPLRIKGDPLKIQNAIEFLRHFNEDPAGLRLGRSVAVIGGGNSAMDGARAALRVSGVEQVTLVYRRTEAEMPADREEFDSALADGVTWRELLAPVSISEEGVLTCQKMSLGEPGPDGRRVVVPLAGQFETISADFVIAAIGEQVDTDFLLHCGIKLDERGIVIADPKTLETSEPGVYIGGDAWRGPSTVVESIADARTAADAILEKEFGEKTNSHTRWTLASTNSNIMERKGRILCAVEKLDAAKAIQFEAERCLQCATICDKCVEVCPNRANVALDVLADPAGFTNVHQILHIDDFCNECGNCATFCPWNGKPYLEKFTVFSSLDEFTTSRNTGFFLMGSPERPTARIRVNGEVCERPLNVGDEDALPANVVPNPAMSQALTLIRRIRASHPYLIYGR